MINYAAGPFIFAPQVHTNNTQDIVSRLDGCTSPQDLQYRIKYSKGVTIPEQHSPSHRPSNQRLSVFFIIIVITITTTTCVASIASEYNMPRSEEAEQWANAVYSAIQEIPAGKVTSYGHIALLLGERMPPLPHPDLTSIYTISNMAMVMIMAAQRPRQVGVCLKSLPEPESGLHYNSDSVPWQRVINSKGMISHRFVTALYATLHTPSM